MILEKLRTSPWFVTINPKPLATMRLFCFPYSGGDAFVFRDWVSLLPSTIEVIAIELPGRSTRFHETPVDNLSSIIDSLVKDFKAISNKPFVFLGHSVGAKISFELCKALRSEKLPLPFHFFASGSRAPQIPLREKPIYNLPDKEFIQELEKYNGVPNLVLKDNELMSIFLPMIRSDFTISNTYHYTKVEPFPFDITALGGIDDPTVTEDDIMAWKIHTSKQFCHQMLPGDHFFIKKSQKQILEIISNLFPSRRMVN